MSVRWVTKLLISPEKIGFYCPKTTKFGPILAFLVNFGRPCRLIRCPVGGSVGGCGARAVSRKISIYFTLLTRCFNSKCCPQISLNLALLMAADHVPQKLSWSKLNMISLLGDLLFFEMLLHMLKESRPGGANVSSFASESRVVNQSVMNIIFLLVLPLIWQRRGL